jgi:putative membrane protein insertion efficiency factor
MSLPRQIAVFPIRLYQWCISPLLGTHCRFEPSCSHYAHAAVAEHGACRGSWLAFKRILRCNPFGRSGYDPVPPAQTE